MKQLLKSCLIKIFNMAKTFATGKTDRNELQSLLKKLYPLSGKKELIRLGPKGDGGYLLPNDLVGIQACFSPGVGFESGFEKDCAELGIKVFLADKSVEEPAPGHELFFFTKKFVGATLNNDFITLDNWVASSIHETNSDLLLQIDIEGSEYEVFLSASESLMQRFRIIVAEFHELHQLWHRPFFKLAEQVFDKILRTHYCVHIHPNNCSGSLQKGGLDIPQVMEFTFFRKDRLDNYSYQKAFPNQFDYDNTTNNPTLPLPKCWYRS
ncbi:MAG: FkbM family methyltransferase [Deltaproteobacteria bacterium]|nr:FkbM family methyltransferase [Deltaproteobacteria bacterium]